MTRSNMKRRKSYYLLATLLMLVFFSMQPAALAEEHSRAGKVILVSDVHFNPFANSTLIESLIDADYEQWEAIFLASGIESSSMYGEETNFHLLHSALEAVHNREKHPDFIILSGDLLAHDFNDTFYQYSRDQSLYSLYTFIYKTIGFITWKFSRYYQDTPIYFALGNNDSYTGDYTCIPDGEFLHTTADLIFKNLIKDPADRDSFYQTYPVWGYYSVVPPAAKNARIIVLNTNYFSTNYTTTSTPTPGTTQLNWLAEELAASQNKGEKVWIIGHIPAGVNVFSTLKDNLQPVKLQWQADYIDQFVQEMRTYSGTVMAGFAGHTHMDDFRLVYDVEQSHTVSFTHITPAITAVFDNNPAFQVMTYNRDTFTIDNFETYYLNLAAVDGTWAKEYDFNQVYQQSAVDATTMGTVFDTLEKDETTRGHYIMNYSVSIGQPLIKDTWKGYLAGIRYLTAETYANYMQ